MRQVKLEQSRDHKDLGAAPQGKARVDAVVLSSTVGDLPTIQANLPLRLVHLMPQALHPHIPIRTRWSAREEGEENPRWSQHGNGIAGVNGKRLPSKWGKWNMLTDRPT